MHSSAMLFNTLHERPKSHLILMALRYTHALIAVVSCQTAGYLTVH